MAGAPIIYDLSERGGGEVLVDVLHLSILLCGVWGVRESLPQIYRSSYRSSPRLSYPVTVGFHEVEMITNFQNHFISHKLNDSLKDDT